MYGENLMSSPVMRKRENGNACAVILPRVFLALRGGGRVKILDASAKRRKRKREDELTGIRTTSKAKNNEANREYRSPVGGHKDVIYKTEGHIVRQSNYRCKEHGRKRETERVYYTNVKGVSRRAGFYYLRRAAQILAFSTIYCMWIVVVVRNIQILFYETTSVPSNLSLCAYGFPISICIASNVRADFVFFFFFGNKNDMRARVAENLPLFPELQYNSIVFETRICAILRSFANYRSNGSFVEI